MYLLSQISIYTNSKILGDLVTNLNDYLVNLAYAQHSHLKEIIALVLGNNSTNANMARPIMPDIMQITHIRRAEIIFIDSTQEIHLIPCISFFR